MLDIKIEPGLRIEFLVKLKTSRAETLNIFLRDFYGKCSRVT
jgi:hypothetical protein